MQNDPTSNPGTSNKIVIPQNEFDREISYAHKRQEKLKTKGAEINGLLQNITKMKVAKCSALSNMNMKINKSSTKTNKIVEKLTKNIVS